MGCCISYLIYSYLKEAHDTVKRKVLCNILSDFRITLKLVKLINICLNETHSRVRVGKYLSDRLPIKNGLKQGEALSPLFLNFALEYAIKGV